ncbi:hypothetical protein DRJ48_05005 [Candidatus Woesearchaeota archaeon]|nr:MAG: hypothetical protein DRJ48_05005 [Candidatus Woesearchaeota archaeon]
MKQLKLMLLVLATLLAVGFVSATAIPVEIEKVQVDGTVLDPSAPNRLDLERGQRVEIKVTLLATGDASDVQVEAFISGYEYSDFEPVSDSTHVFDVEEGVVYVKKLYITLPEKVEKDNYKLRVIVSDRYSEELIQNYNLKIDAPRHYIKVKDVWFTPENTVYAGEYLIASVRLKNYGDKDEEGIKVVVSIPELGVSATDYIDELEAGDSISSEELYLKIPRCNVEPGRYEVDVEVMYDEGYESAPDFTTSIEIASAGPCEAPEEEVEEKIVVTLETLSKDVVAGGQGVVYPITITNTGSTARTIVLSIPQVAWGSLKLSPSNVLVLNGGETKTAFVYATASRATAPGEYQFSVALNTVEGETLKELTFTANVGKAPSGVSVTRGLEIALVVLILILVVIGLILGLRKLRGGAEESEEEVSGETYY